LYHASVAKPREADSADEGLGALYSARLAEFTAERNALAKRLRENGEKERADEVKALRKPSVPAGAINRGVRADGAAAKRLLKAGERLRSAHEAALGGEGADELREAMGDEAAAVETMAQAAQAASGKPQLGPAMLDRVRDTLRAVAGDEALRAQFEAGRVERDTKPVGLGSGLTAAVGSKAKPKVERGPAAAQRRRAEQRVTRARKALDASRAALASAEREVTDSRGALKQAERRAESAKRKRDQAQDELDEAEAAQGL
jgi:hypothetical protein